MNGSQSVRFSELFADTLCAHGVMWSFDYYTSHGMSELEFSLWFRIWSGRAFEGASYYA